MIAQDIIEAALEDIGVATPGYTISGNDNAIGFKRLNQLLNSISTINASSFARTKESTLLVTDQAAYTIGSGGDFNTVRPKDIRMVWIEDTSGITYDVTLVTEKSMERLSLKSTGTIPDWCYYEPQYPLGKFTLYPVPTANEAGWSFFVSSMKSLAQFTDLTTDNPLPEEYYEYLQYQLGLRLASPFGKVVPGWVQEKAGQTEKDIKNRNYQPVRLNTDLPVMRGRRRNNIYGDSNG